MPLAVAAALWKPLTKSVRQFLIASGLSLFNKTPVCALKKKGFQPDFNMKTPSSRLPPPVFTLLLVLSGCQSIEVAPPAEPLPASMIFEAPFARVWPAASAEIGLNYPLAAVEKEAGLLATDYFIVPLGEKNRFLPFYVFLPEGVSPARKILRMRMNVHVFRQPRERCVVKIRACYEMSENRPLVSWVPAETTGAFENGVLTRIRRRLSVPDE